MHNRVTLARAVLLLTITLCSLGAYVSPLHAAGKQYVSIATGGVTGTYFPAGTAICRMVNLERKTHGVRCSAERTSDAVANIRELSYGKFDFALVPSDRQYQASRGEGVFEKSGPFEDLRAVFSLHAELFTVIVRADSNIGTFDDLEGKRVNVGPSGSDQRGLMQDLIAAKGWTMGTFEKTFELKPSEQTRALCDKEVDAVSFVVAHPSGSVRESTKYCPVRIIDVSDRDINNLVSQNPYYSREIVPGKMYVENPDEVITFSVRATLVTKESTSPEAVFAVVSSVFRNLDKFQRLHPTFARLDRKDMAEKSLTVPLHEGARKYYEEMGLLK